MHDCKGRNYWHEFKDDFEKILLKKNLEQIINETYYECQEPGMLVQQTEG
jgi:hypothetical protein